MPAQGNAGVGHLSTVDERPIAGRYRLERQLGSGGTGTVWRAIDETLRRAVAVKLLHPALEGDGDTVARLRQEAASAAKLTHPNAVVLYDLGEDDDRVYLVMELVDGPTLADLIRRGAVSADVVQSIGLDVARALGAAHARGLIHRDVKPANVLLNRAGTAKVADFGIAKALGDPQSRLTSPGSVVGTAAYLAPEQLAGEPVDARADVYALGLLLHEAVTGARPFGDGTAVEVAARRLATDPPSPRTVDASVPEALDDVIVRATRRDRDDRFPDGAAVAAALEPLVPPGAADAVASAVAGIDEDAEATAPADATAAVGTASVPARRRRRDPSDLGATAALPAAALPQAPPAAPGAAAAPRTATTAPPSREASPEPWTRTGGRSERRVDRSPPRWAMPLAVVLGILVGVVAAVLLVRAVTDDPVPTETAAQPSPPAAAGSAQPAAGPAQVEIVDAADFDPPDGGGDGEEHAGEVANAIDGDADTAWTTEGYDTAELGGLKPGVGIWFDLGQSRTVTEVQLDLGGGSTFELYASDDVPDDIDGWGDPVASIDDAAPETRIEIDGVAGRYWLVWLTSLPSDGGRHRSAIAEARFLAQS